jgi:hypothetical protein
MKALRYLAETEEKKNSEDRGIHNPEGWRRDLKYKVSNESGYYCIPLE